MTLLEEAVEERSGHKTIRITTRTSGLDRMLGALLKMWGFDLVDQEEESALVLREEEWLPGHPASVLRLRGRAEGVTQLVFPLRLEDLFLALETRAHQTPRAHIRLRDAIPCALEIGGSESAHQATITNLSDRGCRVRYNRELVKGQEVQLEFELHGELLRIGGRAIYCVDLEDEGGSETGVIYERASRELCDRLREMVIASTLEAVRARIDGATFREGLTLLDLPGGVRRRLGMTEG